MPPVDRHNPIRCDSSDSRWSLMDFMREYPDDAACLEFLWREGFSEDGTHADCPKCEQHRVFKRYATAQRRQSWTCTGCGHHVHPTAGTIFHKSSTSLHLWFYAIHLMTSTRCGISAKQLERELGVNYKTAWRMLQKIRNDLMEQDDEAMRGPVEVDETYVGGKPRASRRGVRGHPTRERMPHKTPVFGIVQRRGQVRATTVEDAKRETLFPLIHQHVLPKSMIYTDDYAVYSRLTPRYFHRRIAHSQRIYVAGDIHTNTIEGFFGLVKSGIRGTYHSVSAKRLQGYLNEYAWRYNHRDDERSQFESLLLRSAR